tara:strand:+ start:113665 stop:114816 length:1152 start_codon:yes stop_codon:yes gene_type:complete
MKNFIATLLTPFIILPTLSFAQEQDKKPENLVPNPSFEEVEKKVKEPGQIDLATPWFSASTAPVDLYSKKAKNPQITVPRNNYGEEKPLTGDNYAGFTAYGYKNKAKRSYIEVKLTKPLEAGKEYCVKFHISSADISKYAVNDIGAYLSKTKVVAKSDEKLNNVPQIISRKHTVYTKQFYWTPVCGVYKAKGGEQYLVIGNFTDDAKLKVVKQRRPRGFTTPQTYDAYYYIDDVSVIPAEEVKSCDCDTKPGEQRMETVKREFESDPNAIVEEQKAAAAKVTTIMFDEKKSNLTEDDIKLIDGIIAKMKAQPESKVLLEGFIDPSESDVVDLDKKRVFAIYKYMVSKGIAKERIERKYSNSQKLADTTGNKPQANMRVVITFK